MFLNCHILFISLCKQNQPFYGTFDAFITDLIPHANRLLETKFNKDDTDEKNVNKATVTSAMKAVDSLLELGESYLIEESAKNEKNVSGKHYILRLFRSRESNKFKTLLII